jgi:hypothetical protein
MGVGAAAGDKLVTADTSSLRSDRRRLLGNMGSLSRLACRNSHKGSHVYLLTPQGIKEKACVTIRFPQRMMRQYDALRAEIVALHRKTGGQGDQAVSSVKDSARQRPRVG